MTMKKICALLLAAAVAAAISGCGGDTAATREFTGYTDFVSTGESDGFGYAVYEDHAEITSYVAPGTSAATEINFPSTLGGKPVTVILNTALADNTDVTSVKIPDTVEYIDNNAFSGCSSLENIIIPNSVKSIGHGAFSGTPWFNSLSGEFVTVGDGVLIKYGGDGGDITLPKKVKYVSDAFINNNRIFSVRIPDSVAGISDFAFSGCGSLTEVYIPEGMYDIGCGAFEGTPWLEANDEDFIIVGDGVLIDYKGSETDVRIPDEVKYIAGAFSGNEDVVSVTVPATVELVKNMSFYNCTALDSVIFEGGDTYIWKNCFYDCDSLESVTLPKNLKIINSYMFANCIKLEEISLPDGVQYIDAMAFYNCAALKSIDFPDSLAELGTGALFGCIALKSAELPDTVTRLGKYLFGYCYELESCDIPPTVSEIPEGLFLYCSKLPEVTLSERIKSVGTSAFESCGNIKVTVEGEFTVLSEGCFNKCEETAQLVCPADSAAEKFAEKHNIAHTGN